MKLARVRISNFRCFKDEVAIDFGDITAIVGRNDVGKSSILDALAIWFEEATLDSDDACMGGDRSDVHIVCEFTDLPTAIVLDANYQTDLAAEYLLNRDGRLEVHKCFDGSLKAPKLKRTFIFASHPSKEGFSDLLTLKNAELKARATELGVDLTGVDKKVNAALRRRIWDSGGDLQPQDKENDIDLEGTRKTWDQLKAALPVLGLFKSDRPSTDQDAEAQDPMKTAVKEAIRAKQQELDAIAEHVSNEVRQIATATVAKIRDMDPALASQLNPRLGSPKWDSVFKFSLTGDENIPINKRGSGVRRLVLVNFFRAKLEARIKGDEGAAVIYAIEEPETSQHPCNQRMILRALEEIAQQPGCQVIITTHTPNLVRLLSVDALRFVDADGVGNRVVHMGSDSTYVKVSKALGVLPDHGVKLFLGVEGMNDIHFLRGVSSILAGADPSLPDLGRLEDDGQVVFIPVGGSNLGLWVNRLEGFNLPEFHLFDRDDQPPARSSHQDVVDRINKRGECFAALTSKREIENYLHPDAILQVYPGISIAVGDFDDVPALVAEQVHATSGSPALWASLDDKKRDKKVSRAKNRLCVEAAKAMTPSLLAQRDPNREIEGWLRQIGQMIASAAAAPRTAPPSPTTAAAAPGQEVPSA